MKKVSLSTKHIAISLFTVTLVGITLAGVTFSWINRSKTIPSPVTQEAGSLNIDNIDVTMYRFDFNHIGTTEYIDYENGSVNAYSLTQYANTYTMNKFDPIMLFMDPAMTDSLELTNVVLKIDLTITYDKPIAVSLFANADESYGVSNERNLLCTDYMDFYAINQTTFDSLSTTYTNPADIIFYKTKYYAESQEEMNFYSSSISKLTLRNDVYSPQPSAGPYQGVITYYVNIDYSADRLSSLSYEELYQDITVEMDYNFSVYAVQSL